MQQKRRDHSLWDIGDALLNECPMSTDTCQSSRVNDGSYAKLEALAKELDHLQIDGAERPPGPRLGATMLDVLAPWDCLAKIRPTQCGTADRQRGHWASV
jgi:hypothetical protein